MGGLEFIATPFFDGCSDGKPTKQVRAVEWFMEPENKDALKETLKECRNNPGKFKAYPNCVNAATANHKLIGQREAPTNW